MLQNTVCARTSAQNFIATNKPSSRNSARRLLRQIKGSYSAIRQAKGVVSENRGENSWLQDNFYVFEECYCFVKSTLLAFKALECDGRKMPVAFGACLCYYTALDGVFGNRELCDFTKLCCENENLSVYFCDIESYKAIACGSVICRTAAVLKSTELKSFEKEKAYEYAVKSLKELMDFDAEKLFSYSRSEKVLESDPAGFYKIMSKSTKAFYRSQLCKMALRRGKNEEAAARDIVDRCKRQTEPKQRHVGFFITCQKNFSGLYFFCMLFFVLLTELVLCINVSPLCLLVVFPIFQAAKTIFDRVFSFFLRPSPDFSLDLEEVPHNNGVLCVITTLLSGKTSDREIFDRLEKIYASNGGQNIFFGVLGDLGDYNKAVCEADKKILSYANMRINELNQRYGEKFFLFTRERVYSQSERAYIVPERKRGAVCALCEYLCSGGNAFNKNSILPKKNICQSIRYCVTLDSDTNLPVDGIKQMVMCMLHPLNTPIVDKTKGVVVSGHGIMQPAVSTTLSGAAKNIFTRIMCGAGGRDSYSTVKSDLSQRLFGNSNFCGKGIFDKYAFYDVLCNKNAFAAETVLSHDAPEGARLNCAYLGGIELTDGFPKNELSYFKREHRWIRGDVQNLIFLLPKVKNVYGERIRNNISYLYRFRLFDNVRRHFTPVFSLCALICAIFTQKAVSDVLCFFALFYTFLPFLLDMIFALIRPKHLLKNISGSFFTPWVSPGLVGSLFRSLAELFMLSKSAFTSLDASVRAFVRMFKRKGLLEWTTAAQSDFAAKDGISGYVLKNIAESAVGVAIFIFCPSGYGKIAGFMWFLLPAVSYFATAKQYYVFTKPSEKAILKYTEYAKDIWSFFDYIVTREQNYLPPDNLQLFPEEKIAQRTSPTNIGLYMLSAVCAEKFGFINTDELCTRLENTLSTVEKLKKYKGHLYNWYDTQSLEVLNPEYISSVDSGNFLACIITVSRMIKELIPKCKELYEISKRLDELFENTDLLCIYNKSRELFSLGIGFDDGKAVMSTNCYDLLMSEERTLSFMAVSRRSVPVKHWYKLSRRCIREFFHMGLASWSGTAFEYFMPALFLPTPYSSLSFEALCFAFALQKRRACRIKNKLIYGTSESAYFAFDADMNYQYRAFGVPQLSLCSGNEKQYVISPYSTFLFGQLFPNNAKINLENMKKCGLYGRYGFYEACDFTSSRAVQGGSVIYSYMAHHMGMSLCACANVCFDNMLVKGFMADKYHSGASELLEEKIPVDALTLPLSKTGKVKEESERNSFSSKVYPCKKTDFPNCFCISDGKASFILSESGFVSFKCGKTIVNASSNETFFLTQSLFCFVRVANKVYSCAINPLQRDNSQYFVETQQGAVSQRVKFTCGNDSFEFLCKYTLCKESAHVLRVEMSLLPGEQNTVPRDVEFALYFEPVLSDNTSFVTHRAFSKLFMSADFDADANILCFHRRKRDEHEKSCVLSISTPDSKRFDYCISREEIFRGRLNEKSFEEIFDIPPSNRSGACIDPGVLIKLCPDCNADANRTVCIDLAVSDNRHKNQSSLKNLRTVLFSQSVCLLSEITRSFYAAAKYSPSKEDDMENKLLCALVYPKNNTEEILDSFGREPLYRQSISGERPIICALYTEDMQSLEHIIKAYMLLVYKGVRFDLCLLYNENEMYREKIKKDIFSALERCNALSLVKRSDGGIFPINTSLSEDGGKKLISASNLVLPYKKCQREVLYPFDSTNIVTQKQSVEISKTDVFFNTEFGFFTKDKSFVCCKDSKSYALMSYVLTGYNLSSVVTDCSLGYTFCRNAAEKRIDAFCNDRMTQKSEEHIYIQKDGVFYDAASCSGYVVYGSGYAKYVGNAGGAYYSLTVFVPDKLSVKLFLLECDADVTALFTLKPIMGRSESFPNRVSFTVGGGCVSFCNYFSEHFKEKGFLFCYTKDQMGNMCDGEETVLKEGAFGECAAAKAHLSRGKNAVFALGSAKSEEQLCFIQSSVRLKFDELYESARLFADNLCSKAHLLANGEDEGQKALSLMFSPWLLYQNGACRFFARSGFFQSGGAYGFRDQLQDALCLMYQNPPLARAHIIRCAAHQFVEGDVLHWWHQGLRGEKGRDAGVRTKISDDYLFLPFAVSEYVRFSGDMELLDVPVRYIDAEDLGEKEYEKFISTEASDQTESIYRHCLKSLYRGYRLVSKRGLCLIGTGDWSDGLNHLGKEGKGESIWLTMFLAMCMDKFSYICDAYGDRVSCEALRQRSIKLYSACEKYGYDREAGYFTRAFADSGESIGDSKSDECKIDLLPQSFACLSGGFDKQMVLSSLRNAYNMLYDKTDKILKLCSAPFDKTPLDVGYIKSYVQGTRENGGQYTHAAVWGSMAFFEAALKYTDDKEVSKEFCEYGFETLYSLLPPLKCNRIESAEKYLSEPYVLCGDVYSNKDFSGRGGWSWYTGSSGWLWRQILSYVLGLEFLDVLTDEPVVLIKKNVFSTAYAAFPQGAVSQFDFGNNKIRVEYTFGQESQVIYSGKNVQMTKDGYKIKLCSGKSSIIVQKEKL